MYQPPILTDRLLLWVYTNPARGVRKRDTAYYKWHEAELLPALLDMPPTLFLSCTRWVAADSRAPTYLSLYDLARHSAVHDPAYVALSEKHALETRAAAFVESRVYEPVITPAPCPPPPWQENSSGTDDSDGDDERRPRTRYISIIEADLHAFAEGEFCRWYDEEHIPLLARVPGWVSSHRYVLKEKLGVDASDSVRELNRVEMETGSEGGKGKGKEKEKGSENELRERRRKGTWPGMEEDWDRERPPKFLAIHEWASLDVFETKQYRRATNTPWRTEVLKEGRVLRYEIRVFRAA